MHKPSRDTDPAGAEVPARFHSCRSWKGRRGASVAWAAGGAAAVALCWPSSSHRRPRLWELSAGRRFLSSCFCLPRSGPCWWNLIGSHRSRELETVCRLLGSTYRADCGCGAVTIWIPWLTSLAIWWLCRLVYHPWPSITNSDHCVPPANVTPLCWVQMKTFSPPLPYSYLAALIPLVRWTHTTRIFCNLKTKLKINTH